MSMEVGFDTPSYFIKMFKRQKKYTPSKFRKGEEIEGRFL
nr:AraC family transcriptional regulator [Bacillus sp. MB2021]